MVSSMIIRIIHTIRNINEICFLSNIPVPPRVLRVLYDGTDPLAELILEIKTTIEEYDDQ